MKNLIAALFILATLSALPAQACELGDTSQTLLIVANSPDGEQNKVIATIHTADNSVEILRRNYRLVKQTASKIVIENYDDTLYTFDLATASRFGNYCFPVIFAE